MAATTPSRPAPPKPAKPGHVKVVRALYKYDAQYGDELSFEEGEILYISDMSDPSWWKATCGNKTGLIPSNYVGENTEAIEHPLHEAVKRGNISFMNECLTNRVSVNGLDKAGSTPLHWASHGGHVTCVEALLSAPKCEITVQNKLGDTALHSAAWKGHPKVVELLLEKGARVDVKNYEKKTPLDLAKNPECAALIQRAVKPRQMSQDYGDEGDSD